MEPDHPAVLDVVRRALDEDVGDGDLTTLATVPAGALACATITQKAAGVIFGLACAQAAFTEVDATLRCERLAPEGEWSPSPREVLRVSGSAAAILTAERTALNLLQRLSGVATLTARYVEAIEGTGARILDTRKTTPGLRVLEKAAVAAGGGTNHRFGLFDAVLIKENHAQMAGGVGPAVRAVRERFPDVDLVAECEDLDDVDAALAEGAPRLLLDNMTTDELRTAVARIAGRAVIEASGGVSLETVRAIAQAGVDLVSVGALTHSAPALDLSLLLEAPS